jgi:hypothetical protein
MKKLNFQETRPVLSVVVAAYIAYEQNGNQLEATTREQPVEYFNHATQEPELLPVVKSNKDIMLDLLISNSNLLKDETLIEKAKEAMNNITQSVTMSILKGKKVSDFMVKLNRLISDNKDITGYDFSMISYVPKVYEGNLKKSNLESHIQVLAINSKPLGKPKDKITFKFNYIESRYVHKINCYSVFGHDENGNLISFLTTKNELQKSQNLQGKIIDAGPDQYRNNAMVTKLNYVKIV